MVGYGGSSAGSYLADHTSPIPSHCASIVATSTLRVKCYRPNQQNFWEYFGEIINEYSYMLNEKLEDKYTDLHNSYCVK